jgi:Ca2+-binding RTX toxin-like protein
MVDNVAPTLNISGAANVDEAAVYTLGLSASDPGDDTITQWTINWGDAIEVVAGNPASATHTYADGDANYVISATATDEDGTFAAAGTVAVMVDNVAPTADAGGPYLTFDDTAITLTGTGFDVAGAADPLLYEWDFDGNFATVEAVGDMVTFDPVALGIMGTTTVTVALRVSDGDGGVTISTADVTVLGEGTLLIDGVLHVVGSNTENDIVIIKRSNDVLKVYATFNDNNPATFNVVDVTDIQVRTRGGHDIVVTTPNVNHTMTIDGGDGNDLLQGGGGTNLIIGGAGNDVLSGAGGNDILLGGDGNDDLIGGSGDDVLVGGDGCDILLGGTGNDLIIGSDDNDLLVGGGGEDILIGGVTIHDNDVAALDAVMAVWTSSASFNSRVNTLTSTGGLLEAGVAVFDDDDLDILIGGAGRDLVFGDTFLWDGTIDLIALHPFQDTLIPVN